MSENNEESWWKLFLAFTSQRRVWNFNLMKVSDLESVGIRDASCDSRRWRKPRTLRETRDDINTIQELFRDRISCTRKESERWTSEGNTLSCYSDKVSRLESSNNHKMQQSWEFSNSSRNCTLLKHQELMRNISLEKKINFIRYHFHFIFKHQQHQHQIWWCSLEIISVISFSTLVDDAVSSYIYYIGEN